VRSIVVLALVAVAAGTLVFALRSSSGSHRPSPCGPVDQTPKTIGIEAAGAATICLLNQERASRGLPRLAQDSRLNEAAQEHSSDMVRRGYFEHTTPDGRTVQDRLRALGFGLGGNTSGGENIEWGLREAATPAAMVRKWMASPPHRADILRVAFRQVGIGIALGTPFMPVANGATYTTDFGGVSDPTLPNG
jgi:uncharacterized protein YkwD